MTTSSMLTGLSASGNSAKRPLSASFPRTCVPSLDIPKPPPSWLTNSTPRITLLVPSAHGGRLRCPFTLMQKSPVRTGPSNCISTTPPVRRKSIPRAGSMCEQRRSNKFFVGLGSPEFPVLLVKKTFAPVEQAHQRTINHEPNQGQVKWEERMPANYETRWKN